MYYGGTAVSFDTLFLILLDTGAYPQRMIENSQPRVLFHAGHVVPSCLHFVELGGEQRNLFVRGVVVFATRKKKVRLCMRRHRSA